MNKYEHQIGRLFLLPEQHPTSTVQLVGASGEVRTLVLSVKPKHADLLESMIKGLVEELQFPLPVLAVTPDEGIQVWISFSAPVELSKAERLISSLRVQFLDEIPDEDCVVRPSLTESRLNEVLLAPFEFPHGKWSAFIDPTMLLMFKEESWLEMPPTLDKQAEILAQAECLDPGALWDLQQNSQAANMFPQTLVTTDPKQFLLSVMGDQALSMANRIDAAKALLPYFHKPMA